MEILEEIFKNTIAILLSYAWKGQMVLEIKLPTYLQVLTVNFCLTFVATK